MRYQVPQFIETETKIVGPLTLRQFAYVGIGVFIVFILNKLITSFGLFIFIALIIMAISLALAFYKVDNIPLPNYLLRAFYFGLGIKKYTFKKEDNIDKIGDDLKNFTNVSIRR